MESIERGTQPQINVEKLMSLVREVNITDGEQFEYQDTLFHLLLTDTLEESDGYAVGAFFQSTLIPGYDIYLYSGLSEKEQRRVLFHEILEANLRDQNLDGARSHDLAQKIEEEQFGKR